MGRRDKYSIPGHWQSRPIEMLESHAHRALSLSAMRVLDRISVELGHHAGQDNGALPVTYGNFVDYGIDRHAIGPAIRELEALGFIEVTERGRASAGEFRSPNKYRITFQPILKRNRAAVEPTNEWKAIATEQAAQTLAKAARRAGERPRHNRPKRPVLVAVAAT
jgi:hypothetical protein